MSVSSYYVMCPSFCRVYEDVVVALKTFSADGLKVYVFSSGSVDVQKLLFSHTENGDLSEVSGWRPVTYTTPTFGNMACVCVGGWGV